MRHVTIWSTLLALTAFTLAAPAARASITPDAAKVVERYVELTGGRATLAAERSVHTIVKVSAYGFTGRQETWTEYPDHEAAVTVLGPFTLKDGYDGTVGWRVDQNGKLSKLDGKDLEDKQASVYFSAERWLAPDQGGGKVVKLGADKDSAGAYTILEVTPPVGRARQLWFSDKTGLMTRQDMKNDQMAATTRLYDWQQLAGRLRPKRVETELAGMAANKAAGTLDSVWINETIDPAKFAMPEAATSDVKWLKGSGPSVIPMRYDVGHVWVKASINGRPPEDFIIDSGASVSLLDSAYAAKYGLKTEGKMQAQGAGAAGNVSMTQVERMTMPGNDGAGIELANQKLAVLALNRYTAPFFWREAAGILGYDFISRFVIEIDYDTQTLTLADPKTYKYTGKGTSMPLKFAGRIPTMDAKVDGQYAGEFRIDVGSGSTVDLHGPFVKKNALDSKVGRTIAITNGGFGGTFTSRLARMKKFEVGSYSWNDPLVVLSGAETGGLASEDYAGNIGNEILDRFKCTWDYEHKVLYLEPSARYGKRDQFTRAGVQMARYGDTVTAMEVLKGSPAEKAGIQLNDQVVSLDGKPILDYSVDQIRVLFEKGAPGEKHVLEVLRDGKKMKKTIKLKEMM